MKGSTECRSAGCVTCPFSFSEEAEIVQNYGCLPSAYDIMQMKEKSGHNWACHGNETVLCQGFADHIKQYRSDLDINKGNLISYEIWYQKGEEEALLQVANTKSSKR
ncbi:hypothetical protein SFC65_19090 [Priestia filamentosa]|uniref:hypothetical protein n=1 Tax=Priestia filamentosa TaxID=1402861 RepID=UPI003981AF2E